MALIGGDLILNNGNLTALQGTIQLGSVASPGLVSFNPTPTGLALSYPGILNFGNIELSGTASVNVSGLGGGRISITGGLVSLRDRANLVADTLGNLDSRGIDIQAAQFRLQGLAYASSGTLGTGAGGNLAIHAGDSVELSGIGFKNFQQTYIEAALQGKANPLERESGLFAGTAGVGRAGNITIDTRQLTLHDGAVIINPTFGAGAGGNIAIKASQLVDVSASGLLTTAFNQGHAGALELDTGQLIIRDEATVSTATFGAGNSGDIIVRAADFVRLSEFKEESTFGTNLSTSTVGGTGNAGNIQINTGTLLLEGGATISSASGATAASGVIPSAGRGGDITITASDSVIVSGISNGNPPSRSQVVTATLGSADSGDLRINTRRLIIQDGGGVGASTVGAGRGGDVEIQASKSVNVTGIARNGSSPSGIATGSGDALLDSFFPGQLNPKGAAGNIKITTEQLNIRDGATVNVASRGTGAAGAINVVADAIALDNKGSIDATTTSGAGGNINLQVRDLRLRHESRIRTDAGSATGGNITINTDTLVAVPLENSDITANAQKGPGGRVSVTASGIFGTQFRDRLTPLSDITATSSLGSEFNGTVQIDVRGIDPTRGLVELPENVADPSQQIATGCSTNASSSFVITGRGGLPEDPTQSLRGQTIWRDWRPLVGKPGELQSRTRATRANTNSRQPIVEAQGWVIDAKGDVELVANAPQTTPQTPWPQSIYCL